MAAPCSVTRLLSSVTFVFFCKSLGFSVEGLRVGALEHVCVCVRESVCVEGFEFRLPAMRNGVPERACRR